MAKEEKGTERAVVEFFDAFSKMWDEYVKEKTVKDKKRDKKKPYKPKPCPGNHKDMCDILNDWAQDWKDWGDAVHERLWPPGNPDPPDPPPPPPFGD